MLIYKVLQAKFGMFIDNKVVEISFMADEFCKCSMQWWQNIPFLTLKNWTVTEKVRCPWAKSCLSSFFFISQVIAAWGVSIWILQSWSRSCPMNGKPCRWQTSWWGSCSHIGNHYMRLPRTTQVGSPRIKKSQIGSAWKAKSQSSCISLIHTPPGRKELLKTQTNSSESTYLKTILTTSRIGQSNRYKRNRIEDPGKYWIFKTQNTSSSIKSRNFTLLLSSIENRYWQM